jgi:hypothetical protein
LPAERKPGARLPIRVQPKAGRNEIAGRRAGRLLVRVTAAPEAGKANQAARKLVAKAIGVAPGRVEIVRGAKSRDKDLAVEGLTEAELNARLDRIASR